MTLSLFVIYPGLVVARAELKARDVHLAPLEAPAFHTVVLWRNILRSFYVGFYLALGSHSWGRGQGQSCDLGLGRSWPKHSPAGLGQARKSRLKHSEQSYPCPQAWGWEASGQ